MGVNDSEIEEFLSHHGVKGMKWGVRKSRSSPKSPSKFKKARTARKARRAKLRAAYASWYADGARADGVISNKTRKTNSAGLVTALGAFGAWGVSRLSKNPKVAIGAGVTSVVLSAGSITLSSIRNRSYDTDILKKYGQ